MERVQRRTGVPVAYTVFEGEHVSLEVLKQKKLPDRCGKYVGKHVPPYPEVEFHIGNISHVTTWKNLPGIMTSSGFKGGDLTGFSCWSLHIEESDIEMTEKQYLLKEFPRQVDNKPNQDPFLRKFTTSPAFLPESRYGNYRFTFPIQRLLKLYGDQFCDGEQPIMRIYDTKVYKQEIVYMVLVHSPKIREFDSYPVLIGGGGGAGDGDGDGGDDDGDNGGDGHGGDGDDGRGAAGAGAGAGAQAVCAYQSDEGKVVWRAQAMSETHHNEMIFDKENEIICAMECYGYAQFYVWDNVTVAFHLSEGEVLEVKDTELCTNLTACDMMEPYLGTKVAFDFAKKTVEELKNGK